ncbi:MAG: NAD(P)/FAD-dependent oxidoreductase, partial [Candidatus Gastranaerophilales bacterium]|nr:NAD(P)/FAD-dependent oxidoreductase [Candidatus Gastranaerophilales bacterium]
MYDLAVIGLGPAGLEAVSIALKNNLKVVAFEKEELGGTCLNVGCIPTKTILHTSQLFKEINNSSNVGISLFSAADYNWQSILDRKTEIVNKFTKILNSQLSKNITLIKAEAQLNIDYDEVEIIANNETYKAKNVIVATGSKPIELPGLPYDGKFVINSDDFYKMQTLPKRITIVGSGAIGLEWAKILSDLNVEVKLVEKAPAIAPLLDVELQKRAERLLKAQNIEFFKNDYIAKISNELVILGSQTAFETDCILVAIGRSPVLPRATMGNFGEYNITADEYGFTDFENLFVAGDAGGYSMLAHNASYQARCILNKILFDKPITRKAIPSVIYTTPEIASIGAREQDIQGLEGYKIKKILIPSIAKSWCDDCPDGLVKAILFQDKIIGAHVVSKDASSLISIFSILIDKQISIYDIQDM